VNFWEYVFTPSFAYSVIRVSTPLVLATLGVVITSKAGITNIGMEGVMLTSALAAVFGSAFSGNIWVGLLAAILCGIAASLLLGYLSMQLKVDGALACIVFNNMAIGGTVFAMYTVTQDKGNTISLHSGSLPQIQIPILKEIPVLGEIFSNHNVLSYAALLLTVVICVLLSKTALGLRIQAAGEAPQALSSVGVDLKTVRYTALGISGLLGGIGGAFMSMGYVSWFSRDMVAGRGFIALAADAMGNSNPVGAVLSAMLFAMAEALSFTLQTTSIPPELVQMLPYLVTIIGLITYSIKKSRSRSGKSIVSN